METRYPLITIPKPCHVGWENMTPNDRGAHCGVCNKTVWDFTSKTPEEIKAFLIEQAGNTLCGHFRSSQLAQSDEVELPLHLLAETRMSPLSRFAIVALIVFGASLFHLSTAQGQQVRIDTILRQDTASVQNDTVADVNIQTIVVVSKRMEMEEGPLILDGVLSFPIENKKENIFQRFRRWIKGQIYIRRQYLKS